MNDLSECLSTFLNCLNEYPEPETVELSSLLAALAKDLEVHTLSILFFSQLTPLVQYRASCLGNYHGVFSL